MWKAFVLTAALVVGTAAPVSEAVASDAAYPVAVAKKQQDPRGYARRASRTYADYHCLVNLWERESHWNPKSKNKHSSAFGIAQMLGEKSKDPYKQIDHGLRYIQNRYGTACAAWRFWLIHKWY